MISIDTINNTVTKKPLTLGVHEVTFVSMAWSIDRKANAVKGVYVTIEEGANLYIPIFDENTSFQMNNFVHQLGKEGEPWNPDKYNHDCKGKKLKVYRSRSKDGKYINTSFNLDDCIEQKNSMLAMHI